MEQADLELSPLAGALVLLVGIAGLAAFVAWLRRWIRQGYVLAYEPRRRPPWGLAAGMLAVLMTLMGVINLIALRLENLEEVEFSPSAFVSAQMQMAMLQLGFAAAIVAVLVTLLGASRRDLGWPTTIDQFGSDVALGVWFALASLVPLYALQVLAVMLLGVPPSHPLLDQMASTPDFGVFAAVMFTAVVAAPPFEEMVFRLLLQGGLERWEDEKTAWPLSSARKAAQIEVPPAEPEGELEEPQFQIAPGGELLTDTTPVEDLGPVEPGGRGAIGSLGHGWAPILASSFLFAIAHLGNGPSPIALFIFAMFLGYLYQRTHRILPCIIAHATLNFISVAVMILSASAK